MERLERILGQQPEELVMLLVSQPGFDTDRAERFVALAATDLIESYKWQAADIDHEDLSARTNVRNLLGGMNANAIASALGAHSTEVWRGLRAFVPAVLRLANACASSGNGNARAT